MTFDVGVIGGGPAGTAAAILLARAGLSVLLLEASDHRGPGIGQTLSPLIGRQLTRLGVRPRFVRQGFTPAPGIVSVWGSAEPLANDFLFGVHGSGWQVDRAAFDRMLATGAAKAGATVLLGARLLKARKRNREGWLFEWACQDERSACDCRFLIDATGRSGASPLSSLSPRVVLDRLIGVVWTGDQRGEWPYTLIESVDDGWFYSANLRGTRATVAFMTDSDLYRCGHGERSDRWRRQLNKTTYVRERLPRNADLSQLRIVSAASTVRVNPVGKGWCAVGDAAMSYDPLSGLGVHQALESAFQAASAASQYLQDHKPLGAYRRWVAKMADRHLAARQHYYATERRWPGSRFWQRRAPVYGTPNARSTFPRTPLPSSE
jgi:flavin-dependent dehydrogenase